jgi:hypothetical protein
MWIAWTIRRAVVLGGLALAWLASTTSPAGATVFSDQSRFDFTTLGPASIYPATVQVNGLNGAITDLDVTVDGIFIPDGTDVGMVLQAPSGQSLILVNGAHGRSQFANVRFDDAAPSSFPSVIDLPPGPVAFRPANHSLGDSFPPPGPGSNYANPGPAGGGSATLATSFNGLDPNGTWRLFVVNFGGFDQPAAAGGWSLRFAGYGDFTVGQPRLVKRGTRAIIPATFLGPGRVLVTGPPKLVHASSVSVPGAGMVDLRVILWDRGKRRLAKRGKLALPIVMTFRPTGEPLAGETPTVKTTAVKLKSKKRKRKRR